MTFRSLSSSFAKPCLDGQNNSIVQRKDPELYQPTRSNLAMKWRPRSKIHDAGAG
jgi:hypothetical protein